jgi:hypothetical protein
MSTGQIPGHTEPSASQPPNEAGTKPQDEFSSELWRKYGPYPPNSEAFRYYRDQYDEWARRYAIFSVDLRQSFEPSDAIELDRKRQQLINQCENLERLYQKLSVFPMAMMLQDTENKVAEIETVSSLNLIIEHVRKDVKARMWAKMKELDRKLLRQKKQFSGHAEMHKSRTSG